MMFGEVPADLPEDKLQEVVEQVTEECRKIGLYTTVAGLHVDQAEDEEDEARPKDHKLMMQFSIGDVAFSPRVQDPETDSVNDEFRKITASAVDDDVEEIRKRWLEDGKDERGTEEP